MVDKFKVLSTDNVGVLTMTNEIRRKMELNDLELRRDEIIGFNQDIEKQVKEVFERNKQLQDMYTKLNEQYRINIGALSETTNWIDAIKKKEQIEEINKADNVVDIKDKKKK